MKYEEQVGRNIQLARLLLNELAQNPGLLVQVPTGASVVSMPRSDHALSEANRKLIEPRATIGKKRTQSDTVATPSAVDDTERCLGDSPPTLVVDI